MKIMIKKFIGTARELRNRFSDRGIRRCAECQMPIENPDHDYCDSCIARAVKPE